MTPCREHEWVREEVAISVPEESAKVHRFLSDRCVKCGAMKRARDASGNLIPEIGESEETWHEV